MIKPVLQALVLADNIYQDKFTGKMIIAGTFNQLFIIKAQEKHSQNQPGDTPPPEGGRQMSWQEIRRSGSPYAYVSLTGLHGSVPLDLRYVDLDDNRVLFTIKFNVKSDDPLKTIEAVVPIPPLPAPHAGAYVLELLSENELLGSHRVTAADSPPPEAKQ